LIKSDEKEHTKNSNIAQQIFEDLQRQILSGQPPW